MGKNSVNLTSRVCASLSTSNGARSMRRRTRTRNKLFHIFPPVPAMVRDSAVTRKDRDSALTRKDHHDSPLLIVSRERTERQTSLPPSRILCSATQPPEYSICENILGTMPSMDNRNPLSHQTTRRNTHSASLESGNQSSGKARLTLLSLIMSVYISARYWQLL